jgi:hypothetical protein
VTRLWPSDDSTSTSTTSLGAIASEGGALDAQAKVQVAITEKILTEKFTRRDQYTVDYEFTVEDPATFTDKIVARVPMSRVDGLMYEYACHEGNYGMVNILRGERMEERRAREAEGSR